MTVIGSPESIGHLHGYLTVIGSPRAWGHIQGYLTMIGSPESMGAHIGVIDSDRVNREHGVTFRGT